MEKTYIVELTEKQISDLSCYIQITTTHRKRELRACQLLAKEKNDDGSEKFPNMQNNANFWKNMISSMEKIEKILERATWGAENEKTTSTK